MNPISFLKNFENDRFRQGSRKVYQEVSDKDFLLFMGYLATFTVIECSFTALLPKKHCIAKKRPSESIKKDHA